MCGASLSRKLGDPQSRIVCFLSSYLRVLPPAPLLSSRSHSKMTCSDPESSKSTRTSDVRRVDCSKSRVPVVLTDNRGSDQEDLALMPVSTVTPISSSHFLLPTTYQEQNVSDRPHIGSSPSLACVVPRVRDCGVVVPHLPSPSHTHERPSCPMTSSHADPHAR